MTDKMNTTLPITKKDIQYSSENNEVTLKREKFDELMGFLRDALVELETARDEQHLAQFEARRFAAAESISSVILDDLEAGTNAISKWASEHSIQELSQKTGIPYATCHRIVMTGLPKKNVRLKDYAKLVKAVSTQGEVAMKALKVKYSIFRGDVSQAISPCEVVVVGKNKLSAKAFGKFNKLGVKMCSVTSGKEAVKAVKQVNAGMVILDGSSMPKLTVNEVESLFNSADKSPVFVVGNITTKSIVESAEKIAAFAADWKTDTEHP
jgi:hypothetical protein